MQSIVLKYRIVALFCLMVSLVAGSPAQKQSLQSYTLAQSTQTPLPTNSISHISTLGSTIWIGTGKGLAKSTDGLLGWESFRSNGAFARDGIFAIGLGDELLWVSMGYEKEVNGGQVQTGGGYAYSRDNGAQWTSRPQTLDERGDSLLTYGINDSVWVLPVVVPEQNVTFDVGVIDSTVWVASWASGLRMSDDFGTTWKRVLLPKDHMFSISPLDTLWSYAPTDTLRRKRIFERFDPRQNNNMLAFSVCPIDRDTIWCGTAGGVNKSTDGGSTWIRFTRQNQALPILGNWVIAIREQRFGAVRRIWTTNWKAEGTEEQFGVSTTDDGGRTWKNFLHGIRAYDFAFRDSVAYIATEEGIYRTDDNGVSFVRASDFRDSESRRIILGSTVFAVGTLGDTVIIGTGDGLAWTVDRPLQPFGTAWNVQQAYAAVGTAATSYAYPNPFSPRLESVRIHYGAVPNAPGGSRTVTLEIFDYSMNRVRTVCLNATRPASSEEDEVWDGADDEGKVVPNGVYFYRLNPGFGDPLFGKILVLQ